jgi:transcriptional regulator with XRE-family HTH domain
MAELANISVRAYQLYEQGKTEPNIDALIKFADALNVSIDYLVGRTSNPAPLNDVGE